MKKITYQELEEDKIVIKTLYVKFKDEIDFVDFYNEKGDRILSVDISSRIGKGMNKLERMYEILNNRNCLGAKSVKEKEYDSLSNGSFVKKLLLKMI